MATQQVLQRVTRIVPELKQDSTKDLHRLGVSLKLEADMPCVVPDEFMT